MLQMLLSREAQQSPTDLIRPLTSCLHREGRWAPMDARAQAVLNAAAVTRCIPAPCHPPCHPPCLSPCLPFQPLSRTGRLPVYQPCLAEPTSADSAASAARRRRHVESQWSCACFKFFRCGGGLGRGRGRGRGGSEALASVFSESFPSRVIVFAESFYPLQRRGGGAK